MKLHSKSDNSKFTRQKVCASFLLKKKEKSIHQSYGALKKKLSNGPAVH